MKKIRSRLFQILETGARTDQVSRVFDGLMVTLIIANVIAVVASTMTEIGLEYASEFLVFEVVSVAIFTAEYIARLWVSLELPSLQRQHPIKARLRYALTPWLLIDLFAILPFYLAFIIPIDLRALRVFRLIRFFKLARYSPALTSLSRVIREERRALLAALVVMVGLLLFSSSVMFYLEGDVQPEAFGSIADAMWWSLVTLTTVGYGDVVPLTVPGRIFGGIVSIFGIGMYALPIGILASGFASEVRRRDFVVTWGMVARVPLFEHLDALNIAEIAKLLKSRVIDAHTLIAVAGDVAECMYFIESGEVTLTIGTKEVTLGPGDFFGEVSLLRKTERVATVVATTRCQLMELDAADFHILMDSNPDMREQVVAVAEERIAEGFGGDVIPEELERATL